MFLFHLTVLCNYSSFILAHIFTTFFILNFFFYLKNAYSLAAKSYFELSFVLIL